MTIRLCAAAAVLALAAVMAAPAWAQFHHPAPDSAPRAPAHKARPATTGFSVDTPIEKIAADIRAREVFEKHLPGVLAHEHYPQFKTMSTRQIADTANLDEAKLKAMDADFAKIR